MAPAEDDISIEEKRVYAGNAGRTDAYVATETGLVRVAFSADKIGAFDMVTREPARDVAVLPRESAPALLGIASSDGLRVSLVDDAIDPVTVTDEPVVAIGVGGETTDDGARAGGDAFCVATEEGGIDRVTVETTADADSEDDGSPPAFTVTSTRIGEVAEPRAVDGPLVAAADGVHRITADSAADSGWSLASVGLDDARDVAGAGMPLAATGTGLYWLGNGWMTTQGGDATVVAADGDGHATAVVDGDLLVRDGRDDSDTGDDWDRDAWRETELPVDEEAVALGYGPGVAVAVTAAGTLCVDAGDGWRHQVIGVRDVTAVALAERE
ncbi:hypothetical protein [Halorubrum sp. BV1]|uniref:HVO_0234 family beta-propeller protein n=1 Tax=Halorubrum sp. BV1 TaxID=1498500 RepID=UPI000679CC16|nr:hypothetical protein [Halorubrum sp. BV1]